MYAGVTPPSHLKTIVWDVDDVLNDFTRVWFERAWQREHPESTIAFGDLIENPPHRVLCAPLAEYLDSLDAFRASEIGMALPPREDVLRWFDAYGSAFRHIALTATTAVAAPASAAWVLRHFGRWFRVVGFVPSARPGDTHPVYDESKAAFLEWWAQADYFVDDRPENVAGALAIGITAFAAPQPWNAGTDRPLTSLAAAAEE